MWKDCNVVMLSTNEKAVFKGQLVFGAGNNLFASRQSNNIGSITAQHLYITSDEEIKEDDWCVDDYDNVRQSVTSDREYWSVRTNYKKIIATTDLHCRVGISTPSIPQQFIRHYIEEYNKGNIITKVEIEYCNVINQPEFDKNPEFYGTGMFNKKLPAKSVLVINSDNTINIKLLKDSLNRDDVIELLHKAFKAGHDRGYSGYPNTCNWTKPEFDEWIKKNL